MEAIFKKCEICNSYDWKIIYSGPIRDGVFGKFKKNCNIAICCTCKVQRLEEKSCLNFEKYVDNFYRKKVGQEADISEYFNIHDKQNLFTQNYIWPYSLRDKVLLDVGSGGGSLLDSFKGITSKQIAVEPFENYHSSLKSRGIEVFENLKIINKNYNNKIDFAFSIQVIEHVKNPVMFLKEIKKLLKFGGKLVVSTPNRNDILYAGKQKILCSFFTELFIGGILIKIV